ncbi:MAG: hypothetical protein ACE5F1_16190 [Planctomycetota bacterium]
MRKLQLIVFGIGIVAYLAAAANAGSELDNILWKTGIAAMATDVAMLLLWPAGGGGRTL